VDLDAPMAPRANVLSPDEQARADMMKHEGARNGFERTRIALRLILSACTGVEPARLPIVIDSRGKPGLGLPDAPFFNVSHAGGVALVAVTRAGPVGVDIEFVRPAPRLDDIATRFFAPGEAAALRALPAARRLDAFYACWTRKEAFVKAQGSGLANSLAGFEVSVAPGEPARLVSIVDGAANEAALHAFRPLANAWGAICVRAPRIDVTGYELVID
jgi:4'-phosphopantetheinyl transferase